MDKQQAIKDLFHKKEYELIDRYVIRDGKTHPVAIICPGGGYSLVCSFVEGKPYAEKLNAMGISALILYYRTGKKAGYPHPQEDLARAVREVMERAKEWNLDADNYSIWGSSAGGHLAASFATENMGYAQYGLPRPACLVLVYPVITLHRELTHSGTRKNLLGRDASCERESFASIDEHVTADYPRTFLWCGDADRTVPPENSKRMDAALTAAGIAHEFHVYPGVKHGVGLAEGTSAEGWIEQAVRFWMNRTGEER